MMFKSCPVDIKSAGESEGLEPGQFEAIVSVFDNTDSYGDIVRKGAFEETLAAWADSGNPIPIYYSHRMDDPDYNIGHVLEAKEIDRGLWVRGQLDIEAAGTKAPQVNRLMKGRRLTQFSFAYDVEDGGWVEIKNDEDEKADPTQVFELRKLKLYEVGPTPIGANQETELLAVKHAATRIALDAKAGRTPDASHETALREARDAIDSVLAALAVESKGMPDDAQPECPAKSADPDQVTPEEPITTAPASRYLTQIAIMGREFES